MAGDFLSTLCLWEAAIQSMKKKRDIKMMMTLINVMMMMTLMTMMTLRWWRRPRWRRLWWFVFLNETMHNKLIDFFSHFTRRRCVGTFRSHRTHQLWRQAGPSRPRPADSAGWEAPLFQPPAYDSHSLRNPLWVAAGTLLWDAIAVGWSRRIHTWRSPMNPTNDDDTQSV